MLIHNVCMESFALHGLILCVSEDCFSILLCSYIGCKQMLVLHGVILCVSVGAISVLFYNHIVSIGDTSVPF